MSDLTKQSVANEIRSFANKKGNDGFVVIDNLISQRSYGFISSIQDKKKLPEIIEEELESVKMKGKLIVILDEELLREEAGDDYDMDIKSSG